LSRAGLEARSRASGGQPDEARYLDVLEQSLATGKVQADRLLDQFHGDWGGNLAPIYRATSL
jgi:glutamate--cysteine ligase